MASSSSAESSWSRCRTRSRGGGDRERPGGSCLRRWRSRFVCCPKQRSQRRHRNGFSLLWMLRTCLWRFDEMLKDRSQYLHLYGCSPVCVRRCRVRLADLGKTFPQNRHEYRSLYFPTAGAPEKGGTGGPFISGDRKG